MSNLGWEIIMKVGYELVRKIRSRGNQKSCGSTSPTVIIPSQYEEQDGDPHIGKDHDPPVLQRSYLVSMKSRTETPR